VTAWSVESAAAALLEAEAERAAREPLTGEWPELDEELGYRIQDAALRQRLARGETLAGVKLGLTSRSKQRQMNVSAPLVAWLTDAMVLPAGAPVPQDRFIHPRAEPEIVFVMAERLAGPGLTAARAMAAVGRVHAGVEIIDSRYRDFRFTLADVIADNALALAANELASRGLAIEAGQVVLTGGMTDAVPVPRGAAVAFHFTTLGSIHLSG
jgi:2-oxo-3-hexenedioate decarboxylase